MEKTSGFCRASPLPFRGLLKILGWVALLWILALAKARSAALISAAISAKRATPNAFGAKINAILEGTRQKGSWLRRSFVIRQLPDGDAPHSLLAIRPSASMRDPVQYFNSLLGSAPQRAKERDSEVVVTTTSAHVFRGMRQCLPSPRPIPAPGCDGAGRVQHLPRPMTTKVLRSIV